MKKLLLPLVLFCGWSATGGLAAAAETPFDVDVTLRNGFDHDFKNLPVFLRVSTLLGRGTDYSRVNADGFRVFDGQGRELDFAYCRKKGLRMGMAGWPSDRMTRYQTGLLYATSDMNYWHHWYGNQFIGWHPVHKAFVRGANVIGMGEGMVDLRYFETLRRLMIEAKKRKVAAKEVAAARTYLDGIFAFCTGDWHWVGVYNGSPEEWGDDGFYDRWRGEMRRHALAIAARLR